MQRLYNGLYIVLASLCLVFFIILSAQAGQAETVELQIKNEGPAPQFSYLDDVSATRTPDFSDAKLTAVHFWATWCVPCIDELPQVDDTQEIFRGKKFFGKDDFKVIAIAINGRNMRKVKIFFNDKRIEHLEAFTDPTQNMPTLAKLPGLPGTLFVNSQGEIIARANGPLDWQGDKVQKFLKAQLAK